MPPAGGHACVSDHCLTVRRRVLGEDVDADNIIATRTGCPPRVLGKVHRPEQLSAPLHLSADIKVVPAERNSTVVACTLPLARAPPGWRLPLAADAIYLTPALVRHAASR